MHVPFVTPSHSIFRCASALTVGLFLCSALPAQTLSDSAAPLFAAPGQDLGGYEPSDSLPIAAPQLPIAAGACGGDDYWILSSRCCRQHPQRPCTEGCLNYFRRQSNGLARGDEAAFRSSLQPGRPMCIVIHGSYNSFRDVVHESRGIHRWLRSAAPGQPVDIVFFTWPATGHAHLLFPLEIAVLGRRSAIHSVYLARLISSLPADQPLCLIGHSHGSRSVLATLHLLGGGCLAESKGYATGASAPRRIRAALFAPAVDHHWIDPGERYGNALFTVERMLIVRNSEDAALGLYPLRKPFGRRSMGRIGLKDEDHYRLRNLNDKIEEYDAAPFVHSGHAWFNYYERPELAQGLQSYLHFTDQPPGAPPADNTGPVLSTPGSQIPDSGPAFPGGSPSFPDTGATTKPRVN